MKVYHLLLILFILYLSSIIESKPNSPSFLPKQKDSNTLSLDQEFSTLTKFLQTSSESELKQSYDLYITRVTKMRRKKEIIIRKIYEITPIIGEILAVTNVEKINLIVNKFFIMRETDLLRKYIIMWDANSNYISHSAKVLLNLLLCNNKFNRLRCILNLLMEGLCAGDDRSIRIFKEIVTTVIIDTLLKTNFYYFNDLQAKFNLIRIFNKPFHYKPIIKIQFVEKLNISDKLKEMLTFIIMRLKTNEDIEVEMDLRLHQIPPVLANNTRLYDFHISTINVMNNLSPEEKQKNLEKEIEKAQKPLGGVIVEGGNNSQNKNNFKPSKTLSRVEAKTILDNLKAYINYDPTSIRFKEKLLLENEEKEHAYSYNETTVIDPEHLDIPKPQKMKLSEIKEQLKNEYTDFLFNSTFQSMPQLEEITPNYQIGIKERSIYPKYRKHIHTLIRLNELLDEFPPNAPKGSVDVSTPVAKQTANVKTTITKEISPGVSISMQFKEKSNDNKINSLMKNNRTVFRGE